MKLAEVLSGPETWVQNAWKTKKGQHCLLGALDAMLKAEGAAKFCYFTERNRLERLADQPDHGFGLIVWNNAPERTWDDIASLVDEYDRDRMLHP